MTGRNLLALSFRVIGLALVTIAAVIAAVTLVFVLRAETVTGTVVDYSIIQNQIVAMPESEQTGMLYYPVVRYAPAGGDELVFTGPRGRSTPAYETGEEVRVLVSTSNPANARLDTLMGVWGTSIILGAVAVIFIFLGFAAPLGFGGLRS